MVIAKDSEITKILPSKCSRGSCEQELCLSGINNQFIYAYIFIVTWHW